MESLRLFVAANAKIRQSCREEHVKNAIFYWSSPKVRLCIKSPPYKKEEMQQQVIIRDPCFILFFCVNLEHFNLINNIKKKKEQLSWALRLFCGYSSSYTGWKRMFSNEALDCSDTFPSIIFYSGKKTLLITKNYTHLLQNSCYCLFKNSHRAFYLVFMNTKYRLNK